MKRSTVLGTPFVLLLALSIVSHWVSSGRVIGNAWVLSFAACILCVPVLARQKLWLGYAALLYPFIVLGVYLALDWGSLSVGF
jgi:hypothetical protein